MRLCSINMRQTSVAIVVPPTATLYELATPIGVWDNTRVRSGAADPFAVTVCSPHSSGSVMSSAGLTIAGFEPLAAAATADLVIVPTWPVAVFELDAPEDNDAHSVRVGCEDIISELRRAARRGATVVGLCLGAFAVAEAGLVEGREAVTHWAYRRNFSERFPGVRYRDDSLYIDHGDVVTSAGSAAAMDCCLHLVRARHGEHVATGLARSMVTPPHRAGGQTQFVPPSPGTTHAGTLAVVLDLAMKRLGDLESVADLAAAAQLSRRTLERLFMAELGVSPAAWLVDQRLQRARLLLETSDLSIEAVAQRTGLGTSASLRRHFRANLATTPTAYRQTFRRS